MGNDMDDDAIFWKAIAIKFAGSLFQVLDGVQEHEIKNITGLPDDACKRIYGDKLLAYEMIKTENKI